MGEENPPPTVVGHYTDYAIPEVPICKEMEICCLIHGYRSSEETDPSMFTAYTLLLSFMIKRGFGHVSM
jgi:hypothetical protein